MVSGTADRIARPHLPGCGDAPWYRAFLRNRRSRLLIGTSSLAIPTAASVALALGVAFTSEARAQTISITTGYTLNTNNNPVILGTNTNITTPAGSNTDGIDGASNSTTAVTNQGFISGGRGGINLQATGSTVANSGIIVGNSFGVGLNNGGNITNTAGGSISGGLFGVVIENTLGTVTNTGAITASNGFGIALGKGGTIVNSKTISGAGGIDANATTALTNSGSIVGSNPAMGAINFSGSTNDTVTLLTGSHIIGTVTLGSNDTVNMQTSRSPSSVLTFGNSPGGTSLNLPTLTNQSSGGTGGGSGGGTGGSSGGGMGGSSGGGRRPHGGDAGVKGFAGTQMSLAAPSSVGPTTVNLTGGALSAVSSTQIATLDPTALALADRTLLDFTGGISSQLQSRFAAMSSPGSGLSGGTLRMSYSPESNTAGLPLKAPANLINQGTVVWADGFGGARLQDADGLDLRATHLYSGGAIGLDTQVQPTLRIGAFFGGGFGKLGVDQNSQTVNTDYVTGGLYGRYTIEAQFFDVTLFGGATRNSSNRQVFDNLASNGVSNSTASYNGRFIAPEIAYGWNILDRNGVTWTPAARVRYIAGWFDGFSEAGSAQSLIVNSRTVQDLEARLEMALSTTQPFGPGLISTQIKGGIVGLTRLGNTNIDTILIGQNLSFAAPGRDNAVGLLTGFGVDYRFAPNANAFVNFEGIAMTDSGLVGSARGGVEIKF